MAQIIFNIPTDKLDKVVAAIKRANPIPPDDNGDPLFTDNAWAKEAIRRLIVAWVYEYERKIAVDAAAEGVTTDEDVAT